MPAVVGFHGQTVAHAPDEAWTWQLGDGAALARVLNRPVIWDFRTADMAAGGQGAPLAPFFHFALARRIGAAEPLAFLNIGGVANVTWIDPDKPAPEAPGALVAFDTGPGNALVNDWMQARTGAPMDANGAAAAAGRLHRERLVSNSARAFLDRRPPKSLDRNDFGAVLAAVAGLSAEDGAATLTAFTADCVAEGLRHMPEPPTRWLVCGGGRRNATMMRMLAERLDAPVHPVEAAGFDGDMLEAQAFAYLAVRVLRGLPTSAPSTTGCRAPVCGGRLSMPD
jgi:anhydro-N-acetylmuramic acid kinase